MAVAVPVKSYCGIIFRMVQYAKEIHCSNGNIYITKVNYSCSLWKESFKNPKIYLPRVKYGPSNI